MTGPRGGKADAPPPSGEIQGFSKGEQKRLWEGLGFRVNVQGLADGIVCWSTLTPVLLFIPAWLPLPSPRHREKSLSRFLLFLRMKRKKKANNL